MSQIEGQPHGETPPPHTHTYIGVADVQNHQAELTVLILVQLMDQLSVVSLQHKSTQHQNQIPKHVRYIIHAQRELIFQLLAHNIACILRLTSQTDKLGQ